MGCRSCLLYMENLKEEGFLEDIFNFSIKILIFTTSNISKQTTHRNFNSNGGFVCGFLFSYNITLTF